MPSRGPAAIVAFLLLSTAGAAQRASQPGPLVIESMAGKDLFRFYCASCHGVDAKGRGPVAGELKSAPADLTTISARSGGQFPRSRLIAFVTSGDRAVVAHGSPDMPVWGPIFNGLDPSEARTRVRIENLVSYLESLQEN